MTEMATSLSNFRFDFDRLITRNDIIEDTESSISIVILKLI